MTASTDPTDRTRAIVVDDHTLFRELLAGLLAQEPWLDVVAQGDSGPAAVALARQHRPDIALLDVQMPGPGIRTTVLEIHRHCPQTHCVVLTMRDDPALLRSLIDAGAAAYLLKSVSSRELLASIRSVITAPDRIHLSISRAMIKAFDSPGGGTSPLSPRETEILRHVAQAHSNAEVAAALFLAETTVKRHLTNIYRKLGATSRVDAIRRAHEAGILEPYP
ncbi:response regulator transcription factor [Streptomyces sp. AC563]|uniref:response regulator transcription factor n=1 Tax=Streptomyces buecherae TaxID=2763006 RepID=UPI00164E267E|nr:response regulator transcription factor [Streptomyces buecherae]MBC3985404.1 response regulator transcription factor [Streptomyces buecherae]MBC3989655.1 response regulator transcription factor [Streptomyces buecherae]QNJ43758.1 response regulator transcription factor [Streptomyces buecherae]